MQVAGESRNSLVPRAMAAARRVCRALPDATPIVIRRVARVHVWDIPSARLRDRERKRAAAAARGRAINGGGGVSSPPPPPGIPNQRYICRADFFVLLSASPPRLIGRDFSFCV